MLKLNYLQKLSLTARWFLPHKEAAELIDDYRDLLEEIGEEEVTKRFGPPKKLVQDFSQPSQRRRWNVLFAILLLCILIPAIYSAIHFYDPSDSHFALDLLISGFILWAGLEFMWKFSLPRPWTLLVYAALAFLVFLVLTLRPAERFKLFQFDIELYYFIAAVLSLVYFGVLKLPSRAMSKSLIAALSGAFLATGAVYGFICYVYFVNFDFFLHNANGIYLTFTIALVLLTILASASLVLAKMTDRRWRGVFLLAMLGLLLSFSLMRTAYCVGIYQDVWIRMNLWPLHSFTIIGFIFALRGVV